MKIMTSPIPCQFIQIASNSSLKVNAFQKLPPLPLMMSQVLPQTDRQTDRQSQEADRWFLLNNEEIRKRRNP
jgi:hypothetical protein